MNIYVANLSYSVNSAGLMELFSNYGTVNSANVITDKLTGRSRGFGFVEMNDEEGQKAIDALNGSEHEGKTLTVNVARPREERPANRERHGGHNERRGFGGERQRDYNRGGYDRERRRF